MIQIFNEGRLIPLQRVGEQVIDTLVSMVGYSMPYIYFDIDVLIPQRAHTFLIVASCKEKASRTLLYRHIDFYLLTQVVPV